MRGNIVWMELRTGWKGILIFTFIIILTAGGFPSFYDMIKDSGVEDLEGDEYLTIEVPEEPGGLINLTWVPVQGAAGYTILEDNSSTVQNKLSPSLRSFSTENTSISVPYDYEEKHYYSVYIVMDNVSDPVFLGTRTSVVNATLWDEFLQNEAYQGLAGGREISFLDIRGYLALEVFSWWVLLAGIYLAWRAVASVAEDYKEKRMDLIFSTPVSRRRYILGKFTAHFVVTFWICLVGAGLMTASVDAMGQGDSAGADVIFSTFFASLPMLMCIQAFGILGAIHFKSTRSGIGVTFLFIFAQYAFNIVASVSESLQNAKYATIMYYWDYTGILMGEGVNAGHFAVLSILTALFVVLAVWAFDRQDIPA